MGEKKEKKEKNLLTDEEVAGWLDPYIDLTDEQIKMTEELKEYMQGVADDFEKENDLTSLLERDTELLDEYLLNISLLSMLEISNHLEDLNDEELLENAYLKTIVSVIRLSKIINPLGGFGKDRLKASYDMLDQFEEDHWPLVVQITKENVEAFEDLFGPKYFDEWQAGKVNAIGAIRTVGKERYAAGVAAYHFYEAPVTGIPVLILDYIYVQEDFRSFGVGNLLMAAILRMAVDVKDAYVTLRVRPLPITDDMDEKQQDLLGDEFERLQDFLDSWHFDFSFDFSDDYFVAISDLEGNERIDKEPSGNILSLEGLSDRAEPLISQFFRALNSPVYHDVANLPLSYFDKKVSCAAVTDGQISTLLLLHRYGDGDFRLEFIGNTRSADAKDALNVFRYAYRTATKEGIRDYMLIGSLGGDDARNLLVNLVPGAKIMLEFSGYLTAPDKASEISAEDWAELRKQAGFTPTMLEGMDEEDLDIEACLSALSNEDAWKDMDKFFDMIME